MEGLTNALSNGDVPDPYDLLFPSIRGSQLPPKTPIAIFSATGEATDFTFLPEHSQGPSESKPIKHFGEKGA